MKNEKKTNGNQQTQAANNNTELVFIIDKSGSMSGYEKDTIGGFNSMIEKQKSGEGEVYVSTVLFNSESEVIHDRVRISEIAPMTEDDYQADGYTALLDAVGDAVHHIRNVHKYARAEDIPAHTIFVITTDGMENASRRYSPTRVKKMIKKQTDECGWEFIFVGANIDSIGMADDIGIRRERAANYTQSSAGYEECYSSMCRFVTMKRARATEAAGDAWKSALKKNEK